MTLLHKIFLPLRKKKKIKEMVMMYIVHGNNLQLLTAKDTPQNNYFVLLQTEKSGAHGTSSKH